MLCHKMSRLFLGVVVDERVDHDRWRLGDKKTVLRVCDDDVLVLHAVEYTFFVQGELATVLRSVKCPASKETQAKLFTATWNRYTMEECMSHPSVSPKLKENAKRWLEHDARIRIRRGIPTGDLLQAVHHGLVSPTQAYDAVGRVDHEAVRAAVWIHEIMEAMCRHRVVWISTQLTQNGAFLPDSGFVELHRHGVVVREGKRIALKWAADQARVKHFTEAHDDFTVDPTDDLTQSRGDRSARVDRFVKERKICNTMMHDDVVWHSTNPFVVAKTTPRVKMSPASLSQWLKLNTEFVVGDHVGSLVTLRGDVPIQVRINPIDSKSVTLIEENKRMSCEKAKTELRSVWVRDFTYMRRLPATAMFPRVFVIVDECTHHGWLREAYKLGPLSFIEVV